MGEARGFVWYLLLVLAAVLILVATGEASPWRRSVATQFGHKCTRPTQVYNCPRPDRWAGSHFACGGKMDPSRWGVAARGLPCGTIIEVQNPRNGRRVLVPVVDAGPYWAVPASCSKFSWRCWARGKPVPPPKRPGPGWQYANDLDLLPGPAFVLGLGGRAVVRWRVVYRRKARPWRSSTTKKQSTRPSRTCSGSSSTGICPSTCRRSPGHFTTWRTSSQRKSMGLRRRLRCASCSSPRTAQYGQRWGSR